ncbi:MAG: DUF1614 domain-containing protein [Methanomicrobiaceae archaeon]|nr:DUF1614 domain-containing protein [Methanomicrobiaceae archaeon]
MKRFVFNPFTAVALIFIVFLVLFLLPFLLFGLIGGALTNLGFTWMQAMLILLGIIIGSFINIPLTEIENRTVMFERNSTFFGWVYRIPEYSPSTVIAVNVGGALIPSLLSVYLIVRALQLPGGGSIALSAALGVALVALVTHRVARPVRGLGIATPFFIPPLCALACGLVLSWGMPFAAPIIAYVSGTLGTLVGADLLNLRRIGELGAPVASIGGAGTFDGIFLSGIIAAFLA